MPSIYSCKDLTIQPLTQEVFKNNERIKLPHLSFQTLMVLVENFPNAVSFDQLMDKVWKDMEVSQETVTQRIALLRKSLSSKDDPADAYIASIRSYGYRWVPTVDIKQLDTQTSVSVPAWVLALILAVLGLSSYLLYSHFGKQFQLKPQVTSIKEEYRKQAWKYLQKHDHKNNELALGLFRKALESQPDDAQAMIGVSLALSHAVTKFNQPDNLLVEAESMARSAIHLQPQNSEAWMTLGFVYDAQGNIDKAIEHYEKAMHLNPESSSASTSLAYLYSLKGNLSEALRLNLSQLHSQAPYVNLQVANLLELLEFDRVAEKWYQKADELSPDNVFATQQRARHYLAMGQNNQAKEILLQALERGVQRPEIEVVLGLIEWMDFGLNDKVRKHFDSALKVDPSHFEAHLWKLLSQHQVTEEEKSQFQEQWFTSSVNWPDQGLYKALYHIHCNDRQMALQQLQSAYQSGYRDHRWINILPAFQDLHKDPNYIQILQGMRKDIDRQRTEILSADWLPMSFLDPQSY